MTATHNGNPPPDWATVWEGQREAARAHLHYDAGDATNRFMRERRGLGGSGDSHLTAMPLWRMRERSRHMFDNDLLAAMLFRRLARNVVRHEYVITPTTPDQGLNTEMNLAWQEWAQNPRECDHQRRRNITQLARLGLFGEARDGDTIPILTSEGRVQMIEADRCISPKKNRAQTANIVNGVELIRGAPVAYWLCAENPVAAAESTKNPAIRYPIDAGNGLQVVLQLANLERFSANRGIPWLAPVMVKLGMVDDLDFAMILKAQLSASREGFVERESSAPGPKISLGSENVPGDTDEYDTHQTNYLPKHGSTVELPEGVRYKAHAPPIPNPEFMQYYEQLVMQLGASQDMPWIILMMDASKTNFSGWRGALDAARDAWRILQEESITQFWRPLYVWKMFQFLSRFGRVARAMAAAGLNSPYYSHKISPSRWPYVQPVDDANAATIVQDNHLKSPRDIHAETQQIWDEVVSETCDDNSLLIGSAQAKAGAINARYPALQPPVSWRDILNPRGARVNYSGTIETAPTGGTER